MDCFQCLRGRTRLSQDGGGSSVDRAGTCRGDAQQLVLYEPRIWRGRDFPHRDSAASTSGKFATGDKMSTNPSWLDALMSPSPVALVIAVILALSIPIFLHSFVFRASGLTTLPSILLVGPSGSGKTTLLTLVYPLLLIYRASKLTDESSSAAPDQHKPTPPNPPSLSNATSP